MPSGKFFSQSFAETGKGIWWVFQSKAGGSAGGVFSVFIRDVLHRRGAVYAGKQQSGQKRRRSAFQNCHRLPVNMFQIGSHKRIVAGEIGGDMGRFPYTLEQKVIEAEREIESRIAVPGAFRVQKNGAVGSGEDVLGTDVAVD